MSIKIRGLTALALLALAACGPFAGTAGPPTPSGGSPRSPSPAPSPTAAAQPRTIRVWLPPALAPDAPAEPGARFAARLEAFEQANPGIRVAVRVKDLSGPGGLLETLSAASRAAPAALPDLIALPAPALNTASLKGLIVPIDGFVAQDTFEGWYDHAQAVVRLEDQLYGIPFASQIEVLGYRRDLFPDPPRTWADLLNADGPFLFPAADPSGSFVLAQYLALGGPVRDEAGRPALDPTLLADVLAFAASAHTAGVLPLSARQFTAPEETWAALREGRVIAAVVPLDDFVREFDPEQMSAVPLPTREGSGVGLAETWSWALVARDPQRQELAMALVSWLAQSEFSGPWTEGLGLLPVSAAQLDRWSSVAKQNILRLVVPVTRAMPSEEILITFGPPIQAALDAVLSGTATAQNAALAAAQAVQP